MFSMDYIFFKVAASVSDKQSVQGGPKQNEIMLKKKKKKKDALAD